MQHYNWFLLYRIKNTGCRQQQKSGFTLINNKLAEFSKYSTINIFHRKMDKQPHSCWSWQRPCHRKKVKQTQQTIKKKNLKNFAPYNYYSNNRHTNIHCNIMQIIALFGIKSSIQA